MIADVYPTGRRSALRTVALAILMGIALPVLAPLFGESQIMAQTVARSGEEQSNLPGASVYLPLQHPAYITLEQFRAAGLLKGRWLNRRPLTRKVVAEAISNGIREARGKGMTVLAEAGMWRLREFTREIGSIGEINEPRSAPLRIDWGDDEVNLTAEMTLELGYESRTDIPPDFKSAATGRGGIEIYGNIGRDVGYTARYRQNNESRKGTLKDWAYSPEQTIAFKGTFADNIAYNESSGHISWDGRHLAFDLCLDSPAWGPSPNGNLLLSGHAPSFGNVQGRVKLGDWLRYTMIVGSLKSGIIDSIRSYQPDDPVYFRALERSKYLVGHRLDLRPIPSLQIGLSELTTVADRFPELIYFVPTVSIWHAQRYLNDPDNAIAGIDLSWTPAGGPYLYGSLALDEWQIADTFSDSTSHNWMAFQVGVSWTPPVDKGRWNLWLEATRVLPNVYRHKFPVNDWTHADSWLGFWSAQNSEVVQARISYLASPRLSLAAWGRYARKGGMVARSEQYIFPPSEKFMHGDVRYGGWVGGILTYEGEKHWRITAEAVRAPGGLWPHDRSPEVGPPLPASLGQEWQFFIRWTYNPF